MSIETESKRIAIITYTLNSGGVSTFVSDLADIFESENLQVDIYTTESRGNFYYTLKDKGKSLKNINFSIFRWLPFGRVIHSILTGIIIRKRKYDTIFLVHSYAAQSSLFLFNKKAKVFSIIQNIEKNVVRLGCKNFDGLDGIVCVSGAVYERAKSMRNCEKCKLIENSVPVPDEDEFKNRSPLNSVLKILYIGRMDNWQKGIFKIPDILTVITDLTQNIRLTLVGSSKDLVELKKKMTQKGLENIVEFIDFVPRSEVAKFLSEHHVFLMPSNFEGLPFALMEAMSWGCVPVVSDLRGITDYCVDDGKDGYLIDKDDIMKFAEAIVKIKKTPYLWEKMSDAARRKALEKFSIEKMRMRYMELIYATKKDNLHTSLSNIFSIKELVPHGVIMFTKKILRRIKI